MNKPARRMVSVARVLPEPQLARREGKADFEAAALYPAWSEQDLIMAALAMLLADNRPR